MSAARAAAALQQLLALDGGNVMLARSEDLARGEGRERLTIWLYRVSVDARMREAGVASAHFLLTAHAESAAQEHALLEAALRRLNTSPTLGGLDGAQLMIEELPIEQIAALFTAAAATYRASIGVLVRMRL